MISIQAEDFNPGLEQEYLSNSHSGAVVTFTGLVRDFNLGGEVTGLFLEHYPGMTERCLQKISDEAKMRWPLQGVRVIHRIGQLSTGDRIVFVGVTSAHRHAAFTACEFIMDYLKTQAPFWKKETTLAGDRWLDACEQDQQAAKRWLIRE